MLCSLTLSVAKSHYTEPGTVDNWSKQMASRDVYHQLQARWGCLWTYNLTGKGNDCSISKYYQMYSTVAITGPSETDVWSNVH